jgi:hypothetical protein
MNINIRKVGPYKDVTIEIGEVKVGLGLLNGDEVSNLVAELDKGIYDLDGSRYCKETSEKLQDDIQTCVDGILEGENLPAEVVERLKESLCQIVVDIRK